LVEDSAQAHGATYKGRPSGSIGCLGCFSFYPAKNLGAFGDGGFISTNDEELANQLRLLRAYGETKKYHHELIGYNSRLDALQAAVLRRKLLHLDDWNVARRVLAKQYRDRLGEMKEIITPIEGENRNHVFHIYAIRTRERDSLRNWLTRNNVETGIHYPVPVHLQPAYSRVPFRHDNLTWTTITCNSELSLPMYPELPTDEVQTVCDLIAEWNSPK
jgi:dTDP-4-amino-4,6-dideoxygalactose transaminase